MNYIGDAHLTVIKNRKALVRADFNVPVEADRRITDDSRMVRALPTIKHILANGGSVVLTSHFGRPKKGPEAKFSLDVVAEHLSKLLGFTVHFASDCVGAEAENASSNLKPGEVLLLENTRFHEGETKGDEAFAQQLSKHGDYFVNDAFGAAHRAHASTTGVAKFFEEKFGGFLLQEEIEAAEKALNLEERPFVAIIGGKKVSDKINIARKLLEKADTLVIGGAMAFTFLKIKGKRVGASLVESDSLDAAADLLAEAESASKRILLPLDVVACNDIKPDAEGEVFDAGAIPDTMAGVDIGPQTLAQASSLIIDARKVVWNGPMGIFEIPAFSKGTFGIAQAIVQATEKGAYTLVGGGDSASAIRQAGLDNQVSYVSTGGGALLEYMEGKTLPGIAALEA